MTTQDGAPAAGVDWAARRPHRVCGWERDEDRVVLLIPRFGSGRFGRMMDRLFRLRAYLLRLDDLGSYVWERIDGTRTVAELAGEMSARFGDRADPTEERLVFFLRALRRNGYIEWEDQRDGAATGSGERTSDPHRSALAGR